MDICVFRLSAPFKFPYSLKLIHFELYIMDPEMRNAAYVTNPSCSYALLRFGTALASDSLKLCRAVAGGTSTIGLPW